MEIADRSRIFNVLCHKEQTESQIESTFRAKESCVQITVCARAEWVPSVVATHVHIGLLSPEGALVRNSH